MSLPLCACGSCTCARSRQWVGHSHAGPSVLFANSSCSTAGPSAIPLSQVSSTTSHHAPHESHASHASHDSRNFHGTHTFPSSNIQNMVFPYIPYNNTLPPIYPQSHYFHPSPHVAPVAPQVIPLPSKGRKRQSNAAGRGGGEYKRQRVPAPIVAASASTICGVGPQLPTIIVQPPTESLQTPSASTQLPSASYSSLRVNRKSKERSSSATDVWYFCRTSNSEIKPAEPPPDQELILKTKPRSPFVACKLCKCVFSLLLFLKCDSYHNMYL
jgi:hypothetical protein